MQDAELQCSDDHTVTLGHDEQLARIAFDCGNAHVIFFDNRAASPDPQTSDVWFYDYRRNAYHTLKQKRLTNAHFKNFLSCSNPENRFERRSKWSEVTPDGRWRAFDREELLARDKAGLDLFWLRDASMTDLDTLPKPEVLAEEIIENLRSASASFEDVIQETP
jgi:type I restriction enzyme M protein